MTIHNASTSGTDVPEATLGKYPCDFFGRHLKSGAGRAAHMRMCTQRNPSDPVDSLNSAGVNSERPTVNSTVNSASVNSEKKRLMVYSTVNSASVTSENRPIANSTEKSACVSSVERQTESEPLVCHFCNKTFENKGGCTRHKATSPSRENSERFTCRCSLTFSSLGDLQLHRLRSHPEDTTVSNNARKELNGQIPRQTS